MSKIIVGITGGIAAYKSAELVRLLKKRGDAVRVVMTRNAHEFIGATTLQALTGEPVRSDLFDAEAEAAMGHIELAKWADEILVAPASADFIGRLAAGLADDLLTTLILASDARITLAPAMNQQMWRADAVTANVATLRQRRVRILDPDSGDQACGDVGPGRMVEPDAIVAALGEIGGSQSLAGRSVVITAGPTREPIDPVRYVSNRSSGTMGFALARAARDMGASVTLIKGPVSLTPPSGITRVVEVETAAQMHAAVMDVIGCCDIFIGAAAVADYAPEASREKRKKTDSDLALTMHRTRDIIAEVAALPTPPFVLGFAAETNDVRAYARAKRQNKGLNMIAANRVGDDAGFGNVENELWVITEDSEHHLPPSSKDQLARSLLQLMLPPFAAWAGETKNASAGVVSLERQSS